MEGTTPIVIPVDITPEGDIQQFWGEPAHPQSETWDNY